MKTYVINGVLCALCAIACAINVGIIIREWLMPSCDVYDVKTWHEEMMICTAIIIVAISGLIACTYIFTREAEKYGI